MRKITFIASLLLTAAMTVSAQTAPTFGSLTAKEYALDEGIVEAGNGIHTTRAAKTTDGCYVYSGTTDYDSSQNKLDVTSACVLKVAEGELDSYEWCSLILGSAVITAIEPDEEGGVFVAGNFADEAIVGGTDGNSYTITGFMLDGSYVENKSAAFFVHYDANGVVLNVQTILPEVSADLSETGMYYPEGASVFCHVKDLEYVNSSLYAALEFSNTIKTTDGLTSISSGSLDLEGWGFYFVECQAGAVAQLDGSLNVAAYPVVMSSGTFKTETSQNEVSSVSMTSADGHLYLGVTTTLSTYIKAFDNEQQNVTFSALTDLFSAVGFYVADVDLSAKTLNLKSYNADVENLTATEIARIAVSGDDLIVTGNFEGKLAFDNSVEATQHSDLFAASLDKSALTVNWTAATAYAEDKVGDNNRIGELLDASAIVDGYVLLGGYTDSLSGHALCEPLLYAVQVSDGAIFNLGASEYITEIIPAAEKELFILSKNSGLTNLGSGLYTFELDTKIDGVELDNVISGDDKVYNLKGQRIAKPSKGLYIKNGKKIVF